MTGYSGRRIRKSRRQVRNAFVARPCRFRRWHWYDWLLCILAALFIIYATISLITMCVYVGRLRPPRPRNDNKTIVEDVTSDHRYRNGRPLGISLLVAEIYLIVVMVLVIFWLRYYRNFGYFVILAILIILAILYFLFIGSVATHKSVVPSAVKTAMFNFVTKEMRSQAGFRYMNKLEYFFNSHNCCGIHSYRDYIVWNVNPQWPKPNASVSQECCVNHTHEKDATFGLNECLNVDLLLQPRKSVRVTNNINPKGCGDIIFKLILKERALLKFILHGFIIAILLFIYLILFCFTMWVIHSKKPPNKWQGDLRSAREQEDYAESDIIPGTPAKSMMSDSENTFYAP